MQKVLCKFRWQMSAQCVLDLSQQRDTSSWVDSSLKHNAYFCMQTYTQIDPSGMIHLVLILARFADPPVRMQFVYTWLLVDITSLILSCRPADKKHNLSTWKVRFNKGITSGGKKRIRTKKKGARRSRIFFSTKTTTQELENPWNPIEYGTVMIPDSLQNPQNL